MGDDGKCVCRRTRHSPFDDLADLINESASDVSMVRQILPSPASCCPIPILTGMCRMGEKFIEWSDNRFNPLSLDTIISFVSFYWHTKSYGRAMWSYRSLTSIIGGALPAFPLSLSKPV